jgi:hypothetical protein
MENQAEFVKNGYRASMVVFNHVGPFKAQGLLILKKCTVGIIATVTA